MSNDQLDIDELKVLSVLGRGAKGVVFLVRTIEDEQLLALKVVSKDFLVRKKTKKNKADENGECEDEYKRICFERDVLKQFEYPLLPKLRGVFETSSLVGYAIDYCPGRNLHSLRRKQTENMFSDEIIRFYAAELVLALEYLHGLGVVYRDLKPENIMIQENGHLMLVDFDLSTKLSIAKSPQSTTPTIQTPIAKFDQKKRSRSFFNCRKSEISPEDTSSPTNSARTEFDSLTKSNSFVGTEDYVPPEMIIGDGHDFAVDWWSLGVVLYEMLYGVTPFRGLNRKETFYRILSKKPELIGEATPLRDLIGSLLEKDAKQRIDLGGIKGHDFFKGIVWNSVMGLARPPYIPTVEDDSDGFKEVDMESFVQGIFGDSEENGNATKFDDTVNNKGVWVEGLNNISKNDDFFVF